MNQLRRVQGFAYPTQASRSADVKTGEIAGKEPGVPRYSNNLQIPWEKPGFQNEAAQNPTRAIAPFGSEIASRKNA
ncbi:MAG: hypothetical protein ACK57O_07030, partial [Planctomyces sp.]